MGNGVARETIDATAEMPALLRGRMKRSRLGGNGEETRLICGYDRSVLQIAGDVGYDSEAAFNRAFKRRFAAPPARYRRSWRESARVDGAQHDAVRAAAA